MRLEGLRTSTRLPLEGEVPSRVPQAARSHLGFAPQDVMESTGLQIADLKAEQLANASLVVETQLSSGKISLPGKFHRAIVDLGKDVVAQSEIRLARDEKGLLKIQHAQIVLSSPVRVQNPSAFFPPSSSLFAQVKSWLIDKVATIEVRELEVFSSGKVALRGSLKIWGYGPEDLKFVLGKFLPKVNLNVKDLLEQRTRLATDAVDARELVGVLSKVALRNRFSASAIIDQSGAQPIDVSLSGRCGLNQKQELSYDVQASVKDVKNMQLGERSVTFSEAVVRGVGDLKLDTSKGIKLADAQVSINAQIRDPRLKMQGLDLHMKGDVNLGVIARHATATKGTVRCAAEPLHLAGAAEFELGADGKARVDITRSPVSEMMEAAAPRTSYRGRMVDPKAPALGAIGSAELKTHLAKLTQSPIRSHNRAQFLVDGKASYPERLRMIKSAGDSICWQALTFKDDTSGMALAQALADASKRGVKVRVIVDALGNSNHLKAMHQPNRALELMDAAGVEVKLYNGQAIEGLSRMFAVAKKYPRDFDVASLKGFTDKAAMLKLFLDLVAVNDRRKVVKLAPEDEAELAAGLNLLASASGLALTQEGSTDLAALQDLAEQILAGANSWHEKYVVVDGREAIVGGMNTADCYMFGPGTYTSPEGQTKPGWRDTDLLISGPAVADAHQAFAKNWLQLTGQKLIAPVDIDTLATMNRGEGTAEIQIIQHRPQVDGDHHITNFLIENLKALKKGDPAYFENAYFLPTSALEPLKIGLMDAAKRGVDVRVLTNSEKSTDARVVNQAATSVCRELLQAGVRLFERQDDRMIHSKIASLGGKLAVVGSSNLDNRSAMINSEVIAAIHDDVKARELMAILERDMADKAVREVRLSDLGPKPLEEELAQAVASSFSHML